ncbi:MAG: heme o synthase [Coriobacteriales bacterium]|nr:heme o synthase [Actinomycetes bacterium]
MTNDSDPTTIAASVERPSAAGAYLTLTKPKQTALLLATGIGAYVLTASPDLVWGRFGLGMLALALAVSGCTALNMVADRDIDAKMGRTSGRPLPTGSVSTRSAVVFGFVLSAAGLGVSWLLSPVFGAVVSAGFFFDLVVYTMWLKRRTPLSILFGGISGGMPALAGRTLATGGVDAVGLLLAAGVVLWIPAHILTLSMRYQGEYDSAGVPVWPAVFGPRATRRVVAAGTILATMVLTAAGVLERIDVWALVALALIGVVIDGLAIAALVVPTEKRNWRLFKAASVYMLGAFACLTFGAVL